MPYSYDHPRPALTVDAIVFRRINESFEVLLIHRKYDPFQGMWALPGGFVDMDETCEQAIERELEEETSLRLKGLKQLHTFSALDRDPRGRTVSVIFYGIVDAACSDVSGGDDAEQAKWFQVNKLPELAFDHLEAINLAIKTDL